MNFGGNRTQYVWSGDELVAETNVLGNSISQIMRAGPLVFGEVRNGVAHYYDVDAYNSIIVGTLTDGTVSGRLSYRAFGQVRTATGTIQTPFRFNGYVSDGGDELSSPSRYYSSSTGRFTSMDPAAPMPMDPISWNAYVGMGANPMTYIDPNGRIKILSNGTAMMSEWRGWLAHRAGEVDPSWHGKATAAGVGVGNALIGITEFGLGGVNALANASVLAHASAAGMVGLDTSFADNAASELMGTQAAAAGIYTAATTDAKYQAYDHAVAVGTDAFDGNQTAIAHSSEFVTSMVLPSRAMNANPIALTAAAISKTAATINKITAFGPDVQAAIRMGNGSGNAEFMRMIDNEIQQDAAYVRRSVEGNQPSVVVEGSDGTSVLKQTERIPSSTQFFVKPNGETLDPSRFDRNSSFRDGVRTQVWNDAIDPATGRVNTNAEMPPQAPWDMGIAPTWSFGRSERKQL